GAAVAAKLAAMQNRRRSLASGKTRNGQVLSNSAAAYMSLIALVYFKHACQICTIRRIWRGKTPTDRPTSLEFCAARCMLLQCGSERFSPVTVALPGRFLPRLGPLPQGERPFFFGLS